MYHDGMKLPLRAFAMLSASLARSATSSVSLGLAVLALAACSEGSTHQNEAKAPPAVLVQSVHYEPEAGQRSFTAAIRPRIEADQGFRVTGKVATRNVDTGQVVHSGDVIATLDQTDFRLQLEQAEAELEASRIALEQTSADERRFAQLRKSGWESQATYDRQRTAAEEARGRNLRAERAVELARNALDYATLRADADGVVTATLLEPGQVMLAGQAAIRLARLGEKEALVALPETFIPQARNGEATLILWSQPGKVWHARLRELSPAADPVTRTYAARFSIPEADASIALGMSATLTITEPHERAIARVPLSAIFNQGQGSALWTVDADGHVMQHPVQISRYDAQEALVTEGVAENDRIVTLGVQRLEQGEHVRPMTALSF
jgi:RND family efflux transporter MFP subunit